MSEKRGIEDDEQLDFGKLFKTVRNIIRNILKSIVAVFLFFRKKALFFIIVLGLGTVIGYFLDKSYDLSVLHKQEIIIEPKYGTTKYVYDFIETFPNKLRDTSFLRELKFSKELVNNINNITVEPIIRHRDVLESYAIYFSGNENVDLHHVIEDLQFEKLEDEKYRDFFKHHIITIYFTDVDGKNKNFGKALLDQLKINQYFKKELNLAMFQSQIQLEENKKSIDYINKFLDNISKKPTIDQNMMVVGGEKDIPTVGSLLKEKEEVLERILMEERKLALNKQVYSLVDYGQIISIKQPLKKQLVFLLPLLLFIVISLSYFLRFLFIKMQRFVDEE